VRRGRLADAANVVALDFDGERHGAPYGARRDRSALEFERAGGKPSLLEDPGYFKGW
jgi:hypothetical protein